MGNEYFQCLFRTRRRGRTCRRGMHTERTARSFMSGAARAFLILIFIALSAPDARPHAHGKSKIHYREYSQSAFESAVRENKPVLMVMSAVWCRWCALYNREALSDPDVAAYINRNFISVFVDIDRRSDLKRKYLRGVPTTVVFTPGGKVARSFSGVLKGKDLLWFLKKVRREAAPQKSPAKKTEVSLAPAAEKNTAAEKVGAAEKVSRRELHREVSDYLEKYFDARHGGFGEGRKYPRGWVLSYLLDRHEKTGERRYLDVVVKTLEGSLSGLYDPVEGGFFRYATRRNWGRPRTEKISAVNGALLPVLYRVSAAAGGGRFREAADRTAAYIAGRLYDRRAGGFYGSQSARNRYYRLGAEARKKVSPPPLHRTKYVAWNAQVMLGLMAADRSLGTSRWRGMVLRSLDFMRRELLTAKQGIRHEIAPGESTPLLGQLESNAWAALVFAEAYLVYRRPEERAAARQVIEYSIERLLDGPRGLFIEWRNPASSLLRRGEDVSSVAPLDLNGVMALALLRIGRQNNNKRYIGIAGKVLMNFSGEARKTLRAKGAWDDDGNAIAKAVFLLRAYDLYLERA